MKKIASKALIFILVIVMCAGTVISCSSKGKTLMELDGQKLSVNMFQLFLSRMKGTLCSSYGFGEEALSNDFWDTFVSSGVTYNEYFTSEVLSDAKTYLAALYAFEAEGLELPKSYIEEIDEEIQRLIDEDGEGSKTKLNSILSAYGVNVKMLREAYIMEAKIAYLNDYLFGENGSKIADTLIEEYYQENYRRFKQVFIYTYEIVYETDADGQVVYYDANDSTRISYDKTAKVKKDGEGNIVKDEHGDTVYVDDDGKTAYDKKNGKRNPVLGKDGYPLTREYTKEELIAAADRATLILEACEEGNYTLFDKMVEEYSEDGGMSKYTDGYYITSESDYDSKEVVKAVFDMNEGEIKRVNSDYGIHLVMRYELDEGGYSEDVNSDFFIGKSGGYSFMSDLKEQLLEEYLEKYLEKIVVDEEVLALADIKSIGANFYY